MRHLGNSGKLMPKERTVVPKPEAPKCVNCANHSAGFCLKLDIELIAIDNIEELTPSCFEEKSCEIRS